VPDDSGADPSTAKKEAEERLNNPLKNFPNDIKYFSPDMCGNKIAISNKYHGKIVKEKLWDKFRADACLGKYSDVAKRCSMNDVLWGRYVEHGDILTLNDIKQMILFDMKRKELYPPDYKGDGSESPPVEYLEKLKADGKLDKIQNELDVIARKS
jgi:hypothetical protein